jgi:tetratricopeptide (TPR) repeat protein
VARYLAAGEQSPAALERAIAWDPGNPDLHIRLGRAYEDAAEGPEYNKARLHYETAHRLRPTDSRPWLYLALLANRQGDATRSRHALQEALRLDRHNVRLRWEAALLALRAGERRLAIEHLRYVLTADPGQRDAAFQLARTILDPGESPVTLLPHEPEGLINVLVAAMIQKDVALAEAAWMAAAPLKPGIPEEIRRKYLEFVISEGQGAIARQVWLTVAPDGAQAAVDDAVWNGGFEAERLLGWGLDWRVQPMWGVDVALDSFVAAGGKKSLRLTFNSFPTLNFADVFQFVPVEPGREYQLQALAKAQDFKTRSGLKLEVVARESQWVIAETNAISGTTDDWVPLQARVRIPKDTRLVVVRLRREQAPGPEGNLGGKVWIDGVSLK